MLVDCWQPVAHSQWSLSSKPQKKKKDQCFALKVAEEEWFPKILLDLLFYAFFFLINLFALVGDNSSPLRIGITRLKPTLHPFKFKKHAISGFKMPKFTEALASHLTKYIWASAQALEVSASLKAPRHSAFEALFWCLASPCLGAQLSSWNAFNNIDSQS